MMLFNMCQDFHLINRESNVLTFQIIFRNLLHYHGHISPGNDGAQLVHVIRGHVRLVVLLLLLLLLFSLISRFDLIKIIIHFSPLSYKSYIF